MYDHAEFKVSVPYNPYKLKRLKVFCKFENVNLFFLKFVKRPTLIVLLGLLRFQRDLDVIIFPPLIEMCFSFMITVWKR